MTALAWSLAHVPHFDLQPGLSKPSKLHGDKMNGKFLWVDESDMGHSRRLYSLRTLCRIEIGREMLDRDLDPIYILFNSKFGF